MSKKLLITLIILFSIISLYFIYENYQNIDKKTIKNIDDKINSFIISEENSTFIKLNKNTANIPFHPVKITKYKNLVYYIYKGTIFSLNLSNKKSLEINIPYKTQEIINLSLFDNKLYLLDKMNVIYIYDILKNKFIKKYNFNYTFSNFIDIEPQFISINSDEKIYILDNSQNTFLYLFDNNIKKFDSLLHKTNLTDSVDFYKENKDFYILNRGNILKTSSSDSIYDFNISEQHDLYNYLKVYSNKKLNNIYLIGGYNGTIKVFSKKEKEIIGNYFIKYKNKNLVVYDIFIDKNNLYILADNYLIIFNKFVENDFRLIKNNIDYDLLEESLKSLSLGKLKLPLDNGSSLPLHSSVYPGARRLYRTGVHEGIDFFENVTTKTPVISSKKGIVLRVDKNYKEIDKKKYDNILKESNSQGYTPPDIEDLLRGRQVVLKHDNNLITVYAHLSKVNEDLELNQEIDENDILGYVGNSGTKDGVNHSTKGLHLHFEVHINDKSKKLEYYLGKYLTIEETMQIYQKIISN